MWNSWCSCSCGSISWVISGDGNGASIVHGVFVEWHEHVQHSSEVARCCSPGGSLHLALLTPAVLGLAPLLSHIGLKSSCKFEQMPRLLTFAFCCILNLEFCQKKESENFFCKQP